jgi:hypothetical protein
MFLFGAAILPLPAVNPAVPAPSVRVARCDAAGLCSAAYDTAEPAPASRASGDATGGVNAARRLSFRFSGFSKI